MEERIDHVAKAIEYADRAYSDDPVILDGIRAQVHATLALVEQQRIANLISLMQMQVECDENTDMLAAEAMLGLIEYDRTPATPFGGPDDVAVVRADVREALGL